MKPVGLLYIILQLTLILNYNMTNILTKIANTELEGLKPAKRCGGAYGVSMPGDIPDLFVRTGYMCPVCMCSKPVRWKSGPKVGAGIWCLAVYHGRHLND